MEAIWWHTSALVVGYYCEVFDVADTIVTLSDYFITEPEGFHPYLYARGIPFDGRDGNWGENALLFTVYFKRPASNGVFTHRVSITVKAWVGMYSPGFDLDRVTVVECTFTLDFEAYW